MYVSCYTLAISMVWNNMCYVWLVLEFSCVCKLLCISNKHGIEYHVLCLVSAGVLLCM